MDRNKFERILRRMTAHSLTFQFYGEEETSQFIELMQKHLESVYQEMPAAEGSELVMISLVKTTEDLLMTEITNKKTALRFASNICAMAAVAEEMS